MGIEFNIKRSIVVNGQKYDSVDEMPEDMRRLYEKGMEALRLQTDGAIRRSAALKIAFNGKEFAGINSMPDDTRRLYELAKTAAAGKPTEAAVTVTLEGGNKASELLAGLIENLSPAALLDWQEPKAVTEARHQMEKPRFNRLLLLTVAISALFILLAKKLAPGVNVSSLCLAAACVVGVLSFLRWTTGMGPVPVRITDSAIVLRPGRNASLWKFRDIDHCEIAGANLASGPQNVLVIETRRHARTTIGMHSSIEPERLKAVLESCGVRVETNVPPAGGKA